MTTRIRKPSMLIGAALAAVLLGVPARAGSGDIDPTFGVGGKVTTDFASGSDYALGVALQSDGKIVAAGHTEPPGSVGINFAVARYNADGSLDASFGGDGRVTTDFGTRLDAGSAVAVQPDGRIVVVGITLPFHGEFALARYNVDGSLDASFGVGGKVTTSLGGSEQANAVALQPDGRIVVAGGSSGDFGLARYNADGSLDTTFGKSGKVRTDLGFSDDVFELAIQTDGRIVAAGGSDGDFALARYNRDGSLDAAFGTGGKVTTDFEAFDLAFGLAVQADGRIVAAGVGSDDTALARYGADGRLDASFGDGGKLTIELGGRDAASAVAQQADGKLAAVVVTGLGDFTLVRLNRDGGLDESFGSGGTVTTDFAPAIGTAWDLAIQADGGIVAAGNSFWAGSADFALARYQGGGVPTISIDIKPGGVSNPIQRSSRGVIPVAVVSTATFDAATVDPSTVCFGDRENPGERDCTEAHGRGHAQDVNGDGKLDLVLHYEVRESGIDPGDQTACLNATTFAGASIEGCDTIEPH
jgi:uncharacterized delta-60 repeat protein